MSYQWDELNRLSSVLDIRTGGTTAYQYDKVGRLQEMDYPSSTGVKHLYGYDQLDRLTSVSVTKGASTWGSFGYTLDPAGNRTQLSETLSPAWPSPVSRTVTYGYDPLYRLKNETLSGAAPSGTITYDSTPGYGDGAGFDKVGNRGSRVSNVPGVPTVASYGYDSRDRLTSTDTYDFNGNTTGSGGLTYTYDFDNRLVARNGTPSIQIVYDSDGNRIKKTVGGTPVFYLVDNQNPTGYPQVVEELTAAGATPTRQYTYGLRLISQDHIDPTSHLPSPISYFGYDGHGSVRLLLNTSGNVTDAYTYDAFGILIETRALDGSGNLVVVLPDSNLLTPNFYKYAGEQFDSDLSLHYNRARYYNQSTGRFWTMDTEEGDSDAPLSLQKSLFMCWQSSRPHRPEWKRLRDRRPHGCIEYRRRVYGGKSPSDTKPGSENKETYRVLGCRCVRLELAGWWFCWLWSQRWSCNGHGGRDKACLS